MAGGDVGECSPRIRDIEPPVDIITFNKCMYECMAVHCIRHYIHLPYHAIRPGIYPSACGVEGHTTCWIQLVYVIVSGVGAARGSRMQVPQVDRVVSAGRQEDCAGRVLCAHQRIPLAIYTANLNRWMSVYIRKDI